jgi:phage gpG-like protein
MVHGLNKYYDLLDRVSRTIDTLPRRAATEAVNFSKERFKQQNWVDTATHPWKKRKPIKSESRRSSQRAILVKSGRLRRSIRTTYVDKDMAKIGTDVPYARIHNEGFRGRVSQRVRAHTRNGHKVESFNRVINQHIPQRQFIGNSAILEKRIQRLITAEIMRAIKGI